MKYSIFFLVSVLGFFANPHSTRAQVSTDKTTSDLWASSNSYPSDILSYSANPDKCRKFTKMKKTGVALTIVGGSLFIGGIIGIAAWASQEDLINGKDEIENVGLLAAGYVGLVFGMGSAGAGIPLMIIGNKKSKQYCDKSTGSINLVPTRKGVGLQYRF